MASSHSQSGAGHSETDLRRINFELNLAELIGEDTEVRRSGGFWTGKAPDRSDSTPSLRIWEPGAGRYGKDGWTFIDFGNRVGGKAIRYLMHYRKMKYEEAVDYAWKRINGNSSISGVVKQEIHRDLSRKEQISIPEQAEAVMAFLQMIKETKKEALAWLSTFRGLDPDIVEKSGTAAMITGRDHAIAIGRKCLSSPLRDIFFKAGILRHADEKYPERIFCWDKTVFVSSRGYDGKDYYLRGRRTSWRKGDRIKYISPCGEGGIRVVPFGLPCIDEAKLQKRLLICEGNLDAIGARQMGLPAIATLTRPGFDKLEYASQSGQGLWLMRNRDRLDGIELLILPDADEGIKGEDGTRLADNFVIFAKSIGYNSRRVSMSDFGYTSKDMAQEAARKKGIISD